MENNNKLNLKYPVIVEGKYDKIRLSNIISSTIITLGGFSVFNDKEKLALLRKLCENEKIIILTDSDKAGMFIRGKLKSMIPPERIINVYAPCIQGKEKRKEKASKEGLLGVEGIDDEHLKKLLEPFANDAEAPIGAQVTNAEFYADGFSGRDDSENRRKRLALLLSLPGNMTGKALLEVINLLVPRAEYDRAVELIKKEDNLNQKI